MYRLVKYKAMLKLILVLLIVSPITLILLIKNSILSLPFQNQQISEPVRQTSTSKPTPSPTLTLNTPPPSKVLANNYHIFQTFNNCGPAAFSMALSYYGISVSQQALGQDLRPYQNPQGNNDDKSVTLAELAEKSKEYNLVAFHRPNGNIEQVKLFITYDVPIVTRTTTKVNEDIGHYRIIKGYDQNLKSIIQDDSLQNKNLWYSYSDFNAIWDKFNFEYLVLVPKDKVEIAEAILGNDVDEKAAWQKAAAASEKILENDPKNITARFNLSVALYNIGNFKGSTEEFEQVENKLPFRTLWYQIEPIKAYFEIGNYDMVFEITNKILNNQNRAFSELYIIRSGIYKKQGNLDAARSELEKAVFYNQNFSSKITNLNNI